MVLKKNTHHPSFIIGMLSFVLLLASVAFRANDFGSADHFMLASIILGGIHWVWSVIDVFKNYDLDPGSRIFWIVVVMLIPPVGGMLFYLMKRKKVSM